MKIVSVEAVPIRLPLKGVFRDSLGTYSYSNHGIVVIRSESGEYGVGEIALAWFGGAHALCREVNEFWADHLIGEHLMDITKISQKLDELTVFSKRHLLAKAGIETALLDLMGKTLNLPVFRLLGGKCRDAIPITGGISMESVDSMVESARLRVSEGFKELKIKVGSDDRQDLEAVKQIRKAVPDEIKIRVDANMAWKTSKRAKELIDEMVQYGVHMVEQPLGINQMEGLAWLRANTKALILVDEGAWDLRDTKRCLELGAADLIHVYISEAGGPIAARKMFELAELYHVDCTIGSMPEACIGSSISAHIGLAMNNLSAFASDIRGFTMYEDDVVHENLVIEDGCLTLFERPGLGVTVDFDKLEQLKIQ
jgi:L-alanine-DL-glutamate epimerase-like enolase superfamily enzyme